MSVVGDTFETTAPNEVGPCPLCSGHSERAFVAHDRNREISSEPFLYRRCRDCGVISLVNVPEDLGRFYPDAYYELPSAAELPGLAYVEAHKVAMIRQFVEPGRLVEIGPGAGVFAYAAREAGFEVTAIEMDERACDHVRDVVGAAAVHTADPASALRDLPPSRAIAMWHVIEHLPDPWDVLEAAADNLEPGGVLAVAAPNPAALQFRLLGARWVHVDAPRHLFLIPLEALTSQAAACGLRRASVTTSDRSGRHWNWFGWESAMRRRPAAGPAARPVSAAALGLTLVLRPAEHTGMRGAAYTALFVKDDA